MREILFSGFHSDDNGSKTITLNGDKIKGEWVYGAYDFNKEHKRGFIISVGIDNVGPIAYIQEVIPETVGQYIGLTDKNSNKIFEGDRVRDYGYEYTGIVTYSDLYGKFYIESDDGFGMIDLDEWYIEVVGNKWEVE